MDVRDEIREFLTSRRARITPEQAGLRTYGSGARRVPGLRREEVASLAGVSIAYYTKLERGDTSGVSDTVSRRSPARFSWTSPSARISSISHAPREPTSRPRRRRAPKQIRPGVQRLLDAISAPAMVRNGRMDILGTNQLGLCALCGDVREREQPANSARFTFLDPRATHLFVDWDQAADDSVAVLRSRGRQKPTRPRAQRSRRRALDPERRVPHALGSIRRPLPRHRYEALPPPVVGLLELTYEGMALVADPELTMFAFTAEVGSKSEEALNLLGSWTATLDESVSSDAPNRH